MDSDEFSVHYNQMLEQVGFLKKPRLADYHF